MDYGLNLHCIHLLVRVFQVYFQDGINMKKINCYSKIASLIFLIMFFLSTIIGILPFILFREDDNIIFKIIWIGIIIFCLVVSIFGFFHYKQYICIENEKIVLRNYLYKIKEIDINDCYYVVSSLLSSYGRVYSSEYWICIYSNKETKFFKYGFTNSKKYERIQLIYTEENLNYIKKYINKKYNSFEKYIN